MGLSFNDGTCHSPFGIPAVDLTFAFRFDTWNALCSYVNNFFFCIRSSIFLMTLASGFRHPLDNKPRDSKTVNPVPLHGTSLGYYSECRRLKFWGAGRDLATLASHETQRRSLSLSEVPRARRASRLGFMVSMEKSDRDVPDKSRI